jgi:phage terminase small subunit
VTAKAKRRKLTARQEKFVEEYLVDLNATQAAIRAGYSAKDADVQGPRLLGNVGISESIAKAKQERAKRTGITSDRVLAELEMLAFSDHTNFLVDDVGAVELADTAPEGAHRSVSSIKHRIHTRDGEVTREVEIKLWDKPGMLKLAGRHVGLFPDKLELTGKNGAPLLAPEQKMTRAEMQREIERLEALAAAGGGPAGDGDLGDAEPPHED